MILVLIFGIYFIPNAFLFAKWTRFMTPIFPFFSIFAGYFLYKISSQIKTEKFYLFVARLPASMRGEPARQVYFVQRTIGLWPSLLLFITLLPGLAFMAIYTREDSRVIASKWIYKNIPSNNYILSETANVVDIPVGINDNSASKNWGNAKVISFDFYHLDENPRLFTDLLTHLERADYVFIPSRRIFKNYSLHPEKYKLITKYYQLLFSGKLGFEKIVEISSFPTLYFGPITWSFMDEDAEETYTVFDHPVIRIYRKAIPYSQNEYRILFEHQ